ncbi:MAG TPA: tetratricopeptide repeat protein [Tenuifilaceae bacterium]|nr:tetratricopeptide repeat protein [Tenuifilaceae bacterium]
MKLKIINKTLLATLILVIVTNVTCFGQLNKSFFINKGRYLVNNESYTEAISVLNQVIRVDSTLDEAWFLRGVAKYYLNDFQGARNDLNKTLSRNPLLSNAYLYRAIVNSKLSRHSQAITDLDMAIDLRPNFAIAYFNRGISHILLNEHEKAIADFSKTISLEPKNTDAWINRGTARLLKADTMGAISDYSHATLLNPFYSESYSKRGRVYYETGSYHMALVDFNKALECDSTASINYFLRALTYNSLKKHNEAIIDLNKAISMNPDNALSLYNRGLIKWQIGSNNEALNDFNRVAELNPENILIFYNRGILLYEMKKYTEAITNFSTAIELFPDFANAYLGRSAAYLLAGNQAKSYNDKVFAQSIAEKYKDNHSQPWTDTTKKFDNLIAFSSDFTQKSILPSLEKYSTHSIDIKPFVSATLASKEELQNTDFEFIELKNINNQLANNNFRLSLRTEPTIEPDSIQITSQQNALVSEVVKAIKFHRQKKFSEAINIYKRLLIHYPANPLVLLNLSAVEADMSTFIASFERSNPSLTLNQSSGNKNTNNGEAFASYNEALETLSKVENIWPKSFVVQYNKGNIFALSGKMDEAVAAYSQAIDTNPNFAESWYNRGLTFLFIKEKQKGCADLGVAGEKGIKQAYLLIHRFCRQ